MFILYVKIKIFVAGGGLIFVLAEVIRREEPINGNIQCSSSSNAQSI